ncbi:MULTISPECIES: hypothetical protein [Pseudomonas]|uniref:hypothetical protein n=1 Tax=Pseudomonas TaxID=286 RepID=UPI0016880ADC|nr:MULTISPECIES: hypothetical protein [Pseudomonas]QNV65149.1 hypothetical protein F7661_03630 [Pseudomonas sp. CFA]MCX2813156.1 hypothetical protein [Pseudomonas sp. DCB_E]MCX9141148.1 hypothetical protein [Pseudomonas sp. DCB_Q]MDD2004559.1 hypothetical protein [Pseudomonas putida]MDH0708068.1 hypothetical protein [Pseudomonas sp. GD03862]
MAGNKNSTFCSSEPTWANACVGNNGSPGYFEYSKGFSTAANLLIDQVLSRKMDLEIDDLVYPVCFNMRHSVELRLKGAIQELSFVARAKNHELPFDLSGSHDIGNIWGFFKTHSELLDSRYTDINGKIAETIVDISEVDATGQTFRYPLSNESIKHLTDVASINFFRLKEKFDELERNLDRLHELNLWLKEEYAQGTFTSKLSRPIIYRLARALPPKSDWTTSEFKDTKQELMCKYSIGSRDFSKAVEKIKTHYYLASLIGDPLPLKGIVPDQLFSFFDQWIPLNTKSLTPNAPTLSLDYWDRKKSMLDGIKKRVSARDLIWSELEAKLTPEYLAGLHTLFYFARDKLYVEFYDKLYNSTILEINSHFTSGIQDVKESFMHIFDKTNALSNISTSLFALGHNSLAEAIVDRYKVDSSLKWLERCRNGDLFSYPEFAKY